MQFFHLTKQGIAATAFFAVVLCPGAFGQDTQSQEAQQAHELKGMPPRLTPGDYQAHAQAGTVTVAAEFTRHSVVTPDATFSTDDYVAVEVAFFGPAGANVKISHDDFSLRINEKKAPLSSQVYGAIFRSLKDPLWEPPESAASKSSKTSIGSGSGGQNDPGSTPPLPVHMPIELERAMEQKVQKAALPEGERPMPVAGLIFFLYRGRAEGIHSLELTYSGSAGKAVLRLHP